MTPLVKVGTIIYAAWRGARGVEIQKARVMKVGPKEAVIHGVDERWTGLAFGCRTRVPIDNPLLRQVSRRMALEALVRDLRAQIVVNNESNLRMAEQIAAAEKLLEKEP